MGNSKQDLRGTAWFHTVDPAELCGLDEFVEWLEALLHNPCAIWNGEGGPVLIEIKQMVARLDGLRVDVYPNEHPPPHFHVRAPHVNASFSIDNCELLNGALARGDLEKVRYWHRHAKAVLVAAWNSSRPTSCVVGPVEPG